MPKPMRARVSQKAVLFASDDVLLLADSGWEFPGGRVDRGERPGEALLRECREETGLEVRVDAPVHTAVKKPNKKTATYYVYYRCQVQEDSPTVTLSEEHDEWRWCVPADARPLLNDRRVRALDRALRR
jgi:8-oxo-dGTP diphosphatase